jgi:F-type H+-transporting ATPase subunit b
MEQYRPVLVILLIVPFLLFMSYAEESHAAQTKDFLGKAFNFLVLFGGLAYLLRKPMGKFLRERAASLEKSLQEAKESSGEAAVKLRGIESRLGKLDGEVEQLKRDAEAEGQSIHRSILDEAKKDSERLKHFARQEIEMLSRDAVREIKEYTAALATDLALRRIQDRITQEYHASLIDKSIGRLEKLHEKSNSGTKVRSRTH